MALCPKCGYKLKIFDLKPECPKCGVNLLYYNIEERNEVDALNAEIEHAHTQKKLDRALASYTGSVLAYVRDALLLLTVVAFLLPLCKMSASGPFFDDSKTFTAIQVVEDLLDSNLKALDMIVGLVDSPIVGRTTTLLATSLVFLAGAALMALLELIFSFLSCSKRGFLRNAIFSSLGIIFSIGSAVVFNIYLKEVDVLLPGLMSGSVAFGIYIVAAMFALVLIVNIVIKVRGGIPVKYKQCYVGRDAMKFEDFVAKYGDHKVALETVLANRDEFMPYKSSQSDSEATTAAE